MSVETAGKFGTNRTGYIDAATEVVLDKVEDWLVAKDDGRGIPVGRHMRVLTSKHKSSIPANAAEIHLSDRIPSLGKNASLLKHAKKFRRATVDSLFVLTVCCQKNDPDFEGVEYFYGVSHLANSKDVERFGFTVSEASLRDQLRVSAKHKFLMFRKMWRNKHWRKFLWEFSTPRKATISREKLLEIYAPYLQSD